MRTLIVGLLVPLVVGVVGGYFHAAYDNVSQDNRFRELIDTKNLGATSPEIEARFKKLEKKEGGAKVEVVNGEQFDFGVMPRGGTRRHVFRVKNVGTSELVLQLVRTTCKCTLSKIKNREVAPGETTEIALEWATKDLPPSAEQFEQLAVVRTNDPKKKQLNLQIRGRIIDDYRVLPYELPLSEVLASQETTVPVKILSYRKDSPEIESWKIDVPDHRDLYDFTWEKMPKEQVADYPNATSGLLATLHIKPGLPIGPIRGKLTVILKRLTAKPIERPFRGHVVGDIVMSAPGDFDRDYNLLDLGAVKSDEGATARVFLFIKGPHRNDVKMTVGELDPDEALDVELGPPKKLAGGRTIRYEAILRVPPGAPRVRREGNTNKFGRVIFRTTHPTTKEVRLYVRFVVY